MFWMPCYLISLPFEKANSVVVNLLDQWYEVLLSQWLEILVVVDKFGASHRSHLLDKRVFSDLHCTFRARLAVCYDLRRL
jgi:hypothetical protein